MKLPLSGLLAATRGPVHVAVLAYIGAAGLAGVALIGGVMLTPLGHGVHEAVAPAGELVESMPSVPPPSGLEMPPARPTGTAHPASLPTAAPLVLDVHIDDAPQVFTNPAAAVATVEARPVRPSPASVATLAPADVSAWPTAPAPPSEPTVVSPTATEVQQAATVETPASLPAQTETPATLSAPADKPHKGSQAAATAAPTSTRAKAPTSKPAQVAAKASAAKDSKAEAAQPNTVTPAPRKAATPAPKAAAPKASPPKATSAESHPQGPKVQPAKATGKGK